MKLELVTNDNSTARSGRRLRLGGLVLLLLVSWTAGFGQIPEDVPEAAHDSWFQGLDAFRQGDWGRAIRNLIEVHEAAPATPAIIYNLALSYDFSGFNELLAIGWLNTYAASAPDAVNIPQTQIRIRDLDGIAVGRLTGLFEKAKVAAQPLLDSPDPSGRITAYGRIAQAQTRSRVMAPQALITAGEIPDLCMPCAEGRPELERTRVLQRIMEVQVAAGDLDDAINTAIAISADVNARDDAFHDISLAFAVRGRAERAEAAVLRLTDPGRRAALRREIDEIVIPASRGGVGNDVPTALNGWLGLMRDHGPSLEAVSGVFPDGADATAPLAVVDTLIEAASGYGQGLARLREMRNAP